MFLLDEQGAAIAPFDGETNMERFERRPKARFTRLALLLTGSLAGCAAPLYLHSPSLEKATAKAATSLPDQATALKPFDDQLTALAAFAAREDLAVAQYWTTVRDAHFMRLIAMSERERSETLLRRINDRLDTLIGDPSAADPRLIARRQLAIDERTRMDRSAETQRRNFRQEAPEAERKRDLSCDAVLATEVPARLPDTTQLRSIFRQIGEACTRRARQDGVVTEVDRQLDAMGGLIGSERAALRTAEEKTVPTPPRIAALQEQIRAATSFTDSGSASAGLDQFAVELRRALTEMSEATRVDALTQLSDQLDTVLKEQICGSPAVSADTKAEAGCTPATSAGSAATPATAAATPATAAAAPAAATATPASAAAAPASAAATPAGGTEKPPTNERVRTAWALVRAVAQLADANAPARRSTQWLAAAKAIVAAEKASAQLQLDQAKAEAAASRQRLAALLREMDHLANARQALLGPQFQCEGGAPSGAPNVRCAFAAYVDAWNEGRIPAAVLDYRPIQIQRSFAVRRSRIVAQRQYVLASSGAASLRAYGAGGIRAAEVAQALFDLTAIGLIPGE